jgi:hypothetical protein
MEKPWDERNCCKVYDALNGVYRVFGSGNDGDTSGDHLPTQRHGARMTCNPLRMRQNRSFQNGS